MIDLQLTLSIFLALTLVEVAKAMISLMHASQMKKAMGDELDRMDKMHKNMDEMRDKVMSSIENDLEAVKKITKK